MSYLGKLYEVEKKLSQIASKEKRVKEIKEELHIKETIEEYETRIEEINKSKDGYIHRKEGLEREIDEFERELKTIREAIEGNKFKTQKELKAAKKTEENLVSKIEELKRNLAFDLDEIKQKESEIEKLKNEIETLQTRYESIKKEYETLDKELKEEKALIDKEFEDVLSTLPYEFVQKYLSIRSDFPYGAIEEVDHGHCGNCGVRLPLETLELLQETKGNEIIRCEVCGKILYIPEEVKK